MKSRNIGLDLIRAAAILFVLIDHFGYFFPHAPSQDMFTVFGYFGVEFFFVLSGFLIGRILIVDFLPTSSLHSLRKFYLKRWLRTLPLYYLLLLIFIFLDNYNKSSINLHLYHFVFLQNFFPKEIDFFGVAWSLSIEEWFYLLLPLFFIFTKRFFSDKRMTSLLVTVICCVFIGRFFFVLSMNPSFENIRRNIFLRFDSLLVGVLLSSIHTYHARFYKALQKKIVIVTSFLLLITCFVYYIYLYIHNTLIYSFFYRTVGLLLVSILIGCILPFLEAGKPIKQIFSKHSFLSTAVTHTSIISYSIYLLHLEIFSFLIVIFHDTQLPYLTILLGVVLTFILSKLSYTYIEKPILSVRDMIVARYDKNI